jgi:hypothetical protein
MERELIQFLKAVTEGHDAGCDWHRWFAENEVQLRQSLSRGSFLRLKFHPLVEAQAILQQLGVPFEPSERFHWLPVDVVDERCRVCGERIQRSRNGSFWCPNGCIPGLMV